MQDDNKSRTDRLLSLRSQFIIH